MPSRTEVPSTMQSALSSVLGSCYYHQHPWSLQCQRCWPDDKSSNAQKSWWCLSFLVSILFWETRAHHQYIFSNSRRFSLLNFQWCLHFVKVNNVIRNFLLGSETFISICNSAFQWGTKCEFHPLVLVTQSVCGFLSMSAESCNWHLPIATIYLKVLEK